MYYSIRIKQVLKINSGISNAPTTSAVQGSQCKKTKNLKLEFGEGDGALKVVTRGAFYKMYFLDKGCKKGPRYFNEIKLFDLSKQNSHLYKRMIENN